MSRVMLYPATHENLRQAVNLAFEMFPLDLREKTVLIKPNVLRATNPEEGVTTHPSVLRAVVEKVESMAPAALVVGDNTGMVTYGANEESFQKTGLMEAAMGHYENIGNDSQKLAFNPDFVPTVSVSRAVLDADVIISLPNSRPTASLLLPVLSKTAMGSCPALKRPTCIKLRAAPKDFTKCWSTYSGFAYPTCSWWMPWWEWRATDPPLLI